MRKQLVTENEPQVKYKFTRRKDELNQHGLDNNTGSIKNLDLIISKLLVNISITIAKSINLHKIILSLKNKYVPSYRKICKTDL